MKYIFICGDVLEFSFVEVMLIGFVWDGGFYVFKKILMFEVDVIVVMVGKIYEEVVFEVMKFFIGESFIDEEF